MTDQAHPVVIVGGGFSGTMTAVHLLRRGLSVVLIDPHAELGRGVAYGAGGHDLLLNVPAHKMSAWPDQPDDFVEWLKRRGSDVGPHGFAARALYGTYIADVFAAATAGGEVQIVCRSAIDLERQLHGFIVRLSDGTIVSGGALVLALGNAPPRRLAAITPGCRPLRVIDDPYAEIHRLLPEPDATVGIVGAGLTALDIIVRLTRVGHRGRIVLISRHGLLPIAHREPLSADLPALPEHLRRAPTARGLLRWLRESAGQLDRLGRPGARAVDALRPHSGEIWQRLGDRERARFVRHGRCFWDVHRHRAEARSHATVVRGIHEGRIDPRAARFIGYKPCAGGVEVCVRPRGATTEEAIQVDWLVNCTGPERDLRQQRNRFVQMLVHRGLVCPDSLGLGACTGPDGELLDASSTVVPDAYVVGPWRMADLWESVAVPELRVQALRVAEHLVASHHSRSRRRHDVNVGVDFPRRNGAATAAPLD